MKQSLSIVNAPAKHIRTVVIPGVLIAGTLGIMISCGTNEQKLKGTDNSDKAAKEVLEDTTALVVEKDLDAITEEGVIRMITRFNSSSYFLHRGEDKGFEYEFARTFAEEQNLRLEIVIAANDQKPIDLLNAGYGDFIAANYSITPERTEIISFSEPYNIVDQILVFSDTGFQAGSLEEAGSVTISVRKGSSYVKSLTALKEANGYTYTIEELPEMWDTEAIMFAVAEGDFDATIADANLFQAASAYISGLAEGPVISGDDQIAWGIRANAPALKEAMDVFVNEHFRISEVDQLPRRSAYMNILRQRYFDNRPSSYTMRNWNSPQITGYEGYFSPYDKLVKPLAKEAGVDWKLVLSVMAQESRFDPYAESRMGAIGLMQIIPRFSQVEEHMLWDPETNIREGLRYIKKHLAHYSYMNEEDQISFALATYNAGMGHMADARRLTVDRNRDPNNWADVSESLLLLMQPRFFQNARFGFVRGTEPVNYVTEIKARHRMYENMELFASEDPILQRMDGSIYLP